MLKTKKGVAKRFKLTKKGKLKYHPGGKSHLGTNKKSSRIRNLRKGRTVKNKNMQRDLRRLLPYG
jgi:large subunit ribosomal protein L35